MDAAWASRGGKGPGFGSDAPRLAHGFVDRRPVECGGGDEADEEGEEARRHATRKKMDEAKQVELKRRTGKRRESLRKQEAVTAKKEIRGSLKGGVVPVGGLGTTRLLVEA